jgi:hypothetical protein
MRNPFDDRDGKRRFSVPAIVAMSVGGVVIAAALALFFGWIVMLLWNWLMPDIFKLPTITYWQGWGLVLLSHILVKGGFGPGRGMGHARWGRKRGEEWKTKMEDRFAKPDATQPRPDPDSTV